MTNYKASMLEQYVLSTLVFVGIPVCVTTISLVVYSRTKFYYNKILKDEATE